MVLRGHFGVKPRSTLSPLCPLVRGGGRWCSKARSGLSFSRGDQIRSVLPGPRFRSVLRGRDVPLPKGFVEVTGRAAQGLVGMQLQEAILLSEMGVGAPTTWLWD